jgi:hypothetical protein
MSLRGTLIKGKSKKVKGKRASHALSLTLQGSELIEQAKR